MNEKLFRSEDVSGVDKTCSRVENRAQLKGSVCGDMILQ